MTGGTVVVLGLTGRNFAAGMSGGVAYVYDEDGQFTKRCNTSMVALEKVLPREEQESARASWHQVAGKADTDEVILKGLIEAHHKWTGSLRARHLLDHWADSRAKFVKVMPHEYKRALGEMAAKAAATPEPVAKAGATPSTAAAK
jgi:glutamate synthase (NADPH/NADH) large chain